MSLRFYPFSIVVGIPFVFMENIKEMSMGIIVIYDREILRMFEKFLELFN